MEKKVGRKRRQLTREECREEPWEKGDDQMRRVVLLLMVMSAALLLASGVALAVSKSGGNGDDVLKGTKERDTISGGAGDDRIFGYGERDRLYGDSGADKVFGGNGDDQLFAGQGRDRVFGETDDDFINTLDERVDPVVDCGPGDHDEAYVDHFDAELEAALEGNCEAVFAVRFEPLEAQGVRPGTLTPETTPEEVSLEQVSP
jgi:hypothetical protein